MQPKTFIKFISIIHGALCLGLLIFAAYIYLQNETYNTTTDSNDILIYIVPTLAMAGYFGCNYLYRIILQRIQKSDSLVTKLGRYQVAILIKYALIEAPAFLSLFAYFISANPLYLAIAFSLTVYLFFQRPRLNKIEVELDLNKEEMHQFK